ncbi:MAG TPA: hypothetical protein VMH85_13425 [Terriglobales bacterium]|nr:hypothetical protein [Terriglobales bacterium]
MSTPVKLVAVYSLCVAVTLGGAVAYRTWPRPLQMPSRAYPSPQLEHGRLTAPFPAPAVLAEVGKFNDELSAYLWFDYLRSRRAIGEDRVVLTSQENSGKPTYHLYLVLPNDALAGIPYAAKLEASGFISGFQIWFSNPRDLDYRRDQTALFVATYKKAVPRKLENASAEELLPSVASFVQFKANTDPRVRPGALHEASNLDQERATVLAADVIAVAKFYDLPLDVFLGIGAMENNYLDIQGDLQLTVWKKRAQQDDIILKRRRHRVLVSNYSVGAWQITRETLRYAHHLYLNDDRDYSQLPERLRPPRTLQLDLTDSHVLTTYSGLLLRDLLDRFDGDVAKAVGAYNGGPRRPNPQYAAGVNMVATYARNILERLSAGNREAVSGETLPAGSTSAAGAAQSSASVLPEKLLTDLGEEAVAPSPEKIEAGKPRMRN